MAFLGINPGEKPEYIVVGLGNNLKRFENTRMNIGFRIVDYINSKCRHSRGLKRNAHYCFIEKCVLGGRTVIFAKPQDFMINSGMGVKDILDYYNLSPERLIVIHDDATLKVGTFRINKNACDCDHKGIHSIVEHLSTDEFNRLRIGVGPNTSNIDISSFVLSKFSEDENKELTKIMFIFKDIVIRIFDNGVDETMEFFNRDF